MKEQTIYAHVQSIPYVHLQSSPFGRTAPAILLEPMLVLNTPKEDSDFTGDQAESYNRRKTLALKETILDEGIQGTLNSRIDTLLDLKIHYSPEPFAT